MPVTLNRIWRILRNIATGAADAREYPARAVEIQNRVLRPIRACTPRAVADRVIEIFWNGLPQRVRSGKYAEQLGRRIHRRARRIHARGGGCYTRFLRNVPQLELIRDLVLEMPPETPVKIASIGCSTGAELYSALWMIRRAQPTQRVQALGIDISDECIRAASRGVYPFRVTEVAGITETSYERFFTQCGEDTRRTGLGKGSRHVGSGRRLFVRYRCAVRTPRRSHREQFSFPPVSRSCRRMPEEPRLASSHRTAISSFQGSTLTCGAGFLRALASSR